MQATNLETMDQAPSQSANTDIRQTMVDTPVLGMLRFLNAGAAESASHTSIKEIIAKQKHILKHGNPKIDAEDAEVDMSRYGIPMVVSSLVPPGTVMILSDPSLPKDRVKVTLLIPTRDRYGDLFPVPGAKYPLYSRHTLGAREAARDHRKYR